MNRLILMITGMFSVSGLLLVDSAVKGTALLMLAGIAAMILRRDSAATRHLLWVLAIVAMLAVPALSALLPQWRVLPAWAGVAPKTAVLLASPPSIDKPADGAFEAPRNAEAVEVQQPAATAHQPAAEFPDSRPVATGKVTPEPVAWSWKWINVLPLAWAIGFGLLILRLMAARLMLWNFKRKSTMVGSSTRDPKTIDDSIILALHAACLQLDVRRPVTLLIHPNKAIPVVWGIFRCCLLLPEAARDWSNEQLRSVLLHELAHVKRRDAMAQLLTQIACALHWFNPLVWLAAWRLGVERERACDDLVLASGVRPSAYAGHLLDVVTALSSARWTQACGLAMARKSSLEGRLVAVLSKNQSRRRVSITLAVIALAFAAGVAIPIAMLRAADQKPAEEPKPAAADAKPKTGEKLDPAAEQNLKWGQPVDGLRGAVILRYATEKPKERELPELYLTVQNVSDAAIRLSDSIIHEQSRLLHLKIKGDIKFGLGANDPKFGEITLQSHEAALIPMFSTSGTNYNGHTLGQDLAEGMLKDTHQSMVIQFEIDKAPEGSWTGKLITGDATFAVAAGQPQPKDKSGQALLAAWQHHARANGNFPGGLIARLGDKVNEFIRANTGDAGGDPYAKKMKPIVPRIDASRDWKPQEVVALMDDIAAVTPIPLETTLEELTQRTCKTGTPLPRALANAPWGEIQPSGLRMAYLLEPRAEQYEIGMPLKGRILIQNAGKTTVTFRTRSWHQLGHKAKDAKGTDIKVESLDYLTIGLLMSYRLEPGEFVEVNGTGIGIGARKNSEDWQNVRVGSWIEAKAGDDVTLTTSPLPLSDWNEAPKNGESAWWIEQIKAHLAQELPLPADPEERKHLVYRAGLEIFGTPLSAEEINTFVADNEPTALDLLAMRFANRAGLTAFAGDLLSGPTKFRVLPPDPDAAKKPRAASNPGRYTLSQNAVLAVTRRPDGDRVVNEAKITFSSPDEKIPLPAYEIKLPDGYNTWAAAWVRGTGVLWVQQKETVRSYDLTNPAQVKETILEGPANLKDVPQPILDTLRAILNPPAPTAAPASPRPAMASPKP